MVRSARKLPGTQPPIARITGKESKGTTIQKAPRYKNNSTVQRKTGKEWREGRKKKGRKEVKSYNVKQKFKIDGAVDPQATWYSATHRPHYRQGIKRHQDTKTIAQCKEKRAKSGEREERKKEDKK